MKVALSLVMPSVLERPVSSAGSSRPTSTIGLSATHRAPVSNVGIVRMSS